MANYRTILTSLQSRHIHQHLKGLSMIVHCKLQFFSEPQYFFAYLENFTVITYLNNNSLGNSILLARKTILCCWELIFASENLFKPVLLVSNHLHFDDLVYLSSCDGNFSIFSLSFLQKYCYSSGFICFINLKDESKNLS